MHALVACLLVTALAIAGWLVSHAQSVPAPPNLGGAGSQAPSAASSSGIAGQVAPTRLAVEVLSSVPHDRSAFTQGLVWHDGRLYESTGLYGQSTLREIDRATGEVQRQRQLEPSVFAEGLARIDDRLVQITWKEGVAFLYDIASFDRLDQFSYAGEGWGLCHDGNRLIMSDGSSSLTFRDPATFAPTGAVTVTMDGQPVERLNELECVGDRVYANIWMTDLIVRIDPSTGQVDAAIDAANLLQPSERFGADVLNGIAYDPEKDVFLITGKLWPRMFEVRFVPPA